MVEVVVKRRVGRPQSDIPTDTVSIRLPAETWDRIDVVGSEYGWCRTSAVRHLLDIGLTVARDIDLPTGLPQ